MAVEDLQHHVERIEAGRIFPLHVMGVKTEGAGATKAIAPVVPCPAPHPTHRRGGRTGRGAKWRRRTLRRPPCELTITCPTHFLVISCLVNI